MHICRRPVIGMTAVLVFQIAFFGITSKAGSSIKVPIFFNWLKIKRASLRLRPAPEMGLPYWMTRARKKARFGHQFLIKPTTISITWLILLPFAARQAILFMPPPGLRQVCPAFMSARAKTYHSCKILAPSNLCRLPGSRMLKLPR